MESEKLRQSKTWQRRRGVTQGGLAAIFDVEETIFSKILHDKKRLTDYYTDKILDGIRRDVNARKVPFCSREEVKRFIGRDISKDDLPESIRPTFDMPAPAALDEIERVHSLLTRDIDTVEKNNGHHDKVAAVLDRMRGQMRYLTELYPMLRRDNNQ